MQLTTHDGLTMEAGIATTDGTSTTNALLFPVSDHFIRRTLDLYNAQHIAVASARWNAGRLRASIRHLPYPFTKPGHINYMTAAMALFYVSQVSYLNARLLITEGLLPLSVVIKDEDFFTARDSGNLVFLEIAVRFRRKIWSTEDRFDLEQQMTNIRVARSHIQADFSCNIARRSCLVEGVFIMPIPRTL